MPFISLFHLVPPNPPPKLETLLTYKYPVRRHGSFIHQFARCLPHTILTIFPTSPRISCTSIDYHCDASLDEYQSSTLVMRVMYNTRATVVQQPSITSYHMSSPNLHPRLILSHFHSPSSFPDLGHFHLTPFLSFLNSSTLLPIQYPLRVQPISLHLGIVLSSCCKWLRH